MRNTRVVSEIGGLEHINSTTQLENPAWLMSVIIWFRWFSGSLICLAYPSLRSDLNMVGVNSCETVI